MRLYSFFRSSAAFRVRIALNVKGVDYETVSVNLPGAAHRAPEFRAVNPQATIPTLDDDGTDDDGTILWQSLAIIEYLDARYPSPRLIPQEPVARARVQALAQLIACEVHPLNNLRVLKYLRGELKLDEAAVGKWYSHWIAEAFGPLETLVSRFSGGRYCFGDSLSLADVCLVPQMYNARRFACDLTPYPTLVRIAAGLEAEPAFAAAAPERQPERNVSRQRSASTRSRARQRTPCSMRTSSSAWRPPATAVNAASIARGSSAGSSTRRAHASDASATFVNSGDGCSSTSGISAACAAAPSG